MKLYQTKKGVDEYIEMCKGYDNSNFEKLIKDNLKSESQILEIGMGPGNDFKWLSNNYEVTGSDYSKEFIERAKLRFPKGKFEILDAITIETGNKFDAIYSCKVYQYFNLPDIEIALKRQFQILNNSGLIIHSFWIGDQVFNKGDVKAFYHNKEKLLSIINCYFDVLVEEIYEEFEPKDSLFIIAKKR